MGACCVEKVKAGSDLEWRIWQRRFFRRTEWKCGCWVRVVDPNVMQKAIEWRASQNSWWSGSRKAFLVKAVKCRIWRLTGGAGLIPVRQCRTTGQLNENSLLTLQTLSRRRKDSSPSDWPVATCELVKGHYVGARFETQQSLSSVGGMMRDGIRPTSSTRTHWNQQQH